jgi:hypothetical protein
MLVVAAGLAEIGGGYVVWGSAPSCSLPLSGTDTRRVETAALFERADGCEWIDGGGRLHFDFPKQRLSSAPPVRW